MCSHRSCAWQSRSEIQRPLEMIKKAIAVPAGKDGRYAPWQFTALAGLLEARDKVPAASRRSISTSRSSWVWPAARRAVADEKADEA